MARPIAISLQPPRALTTAAELVLLRQACDRNPGSQALRLRLALLLNKADAFAETIALLTPHWQQTADPDAALPLIMACFAQKSDAGDRQAGQVAGQALSLAQSPSLRAQLLAELAKAQLRFGEKAAAIASLEQALELDPGNVPAFRRLGFEFLRQNAPERAIALTDRLLEQGIGHSRLLATRIMALAMLGRTDEALELAASSDHFFDAIIEPPPGWNSLAAFNAQLALEIAGNPDLRYERFGTSSQKSWRVDDPATGNAPAVQALLAHIAEMAQIHVQGIAQGSHPWIKAQPQRALLQSWCVIAEAEGREQWHMHPDGWMSGGYYVEVPGAVAEGQDKAGCLAFGLPSGLIGEAAAAAFGEMLVRPQPGLLNLFPSHAHHRTFAHQTQERRMCLAFDICPT